MSEYTEFRKQLERKRQIDREFYSIRSLLGNDWAMLFVLLGGREAGKSYTVTDKYCNQWRRYQRPFYWLRLTEASQRKLLANNAEKLIDPDLRRKYKLDLVTNGDAVYEVTARDENGKVKSKKLMARVLALSTFYNDKGSGLFDKDFLNDPNMYYNIALDEMNKEQGERKQGDVVYQFANQLENLVRSTKKRIRVVCIGNTLEEASDILCALNFLPEQFGRYYLRKKRTVIDYIEPSAQYKARRKGTLADILMPTASTFTNVIATDTTLVSKQPLIRPTYVVRFSKEEAYTIWDGNVVAPFNGEKAPIIAMRPYIDQVFNTHLRDQVILMFDTRALKYKNLITFKKFQKALELLKPRK